MTVATGLLGNVPSTMPGMPKYLSIDPGVTTGITFWNAEGKPLHYNEVDITNLHLVLDTCEEYGQLTRIIIEEFRLYQHLAVQQSGSRLETVQVIGMVKRSNYKMNLPDVVEVRADTKEIAAKWSGMSIPRSKNSHIPNWKASYLIGYWWLHHVAKIIPARVLEQS